MAEPKTKIPVTFKFEAEEMDEGPEGHFATGDAELDKKLVSDILSKLNRGHLEAWFVAKVECEGPNGFSGVAYLGACSYESFEDFKKDGYYESMCDDAYNDMVRRMKASIEEGDEAKKILAQYGEEG
jgi:hypothetical protein